MAEGPDGRIWAATRLGLQTISPNGEILSPPHLGNFLESLNTVWVQTNGVVWCGGNSRSVFTYDGGSDPGGFAPLETAGWTTRLLARAPDDGVLIGADKGLALWRGGRFRSLLSASLANGPDVRAALVDSGGNLWIGTYGGGLLFSPEGWLNDTGVVRVAKSYNGRNGLAHDRVFSLHQDPGGDVWIGTQGGLSVIRNGSISSLTERDGLPENVVNQVLEDDQGRLWIGGNRGIYAVLKQELLDLAEGRGSHLRLVRFGLADGLPVPETNGETNPSGLKGRDGKLWFPTPMGLTFVDPREVRLHQEPPNVFVEDVRAEVGPGGEGLELRGGAFTLEAGKAASVEFRYSAISLGAGDRLRFKHRLVGHDSTWQEDSSNWRRAHYSYLKPGSYQFEVLAGNEHGVWSERPAVAALRIEPRFWQTPFFLAGSVLAVAGVVFGVQAYRLAWERKLSIAREQTSLANERNRIARDLHDDLGTSLSALALELDAGGAASNGGGADGARDAARSAREIASRLRSLVWAVNPSCDTMESVADFLQQQVSHMAQLCGWEVRLEIPDDLTDLAVDPSTRHQLALVVRETLANIARHARAGRVEAGLKILPGRLDIYIKDDGKGMDTSLPPRPGGGLMNARARIQSLGGEVRHTSANGKGTRVEISLPLRKNGPAKPGTS